ncbi:MAG: alpha/beta fold hydrolase [Pseudomonadota bacterium]|nr:alpha/beta fold hydrolase [Pseudomonadota bacterium]
MSVLYSGLLILAGAYLLAASYTYFNQDWIIFARGYDTPVREVSDMPGAEPFKVKVEDSITLDGAYIKGSNSQSALILVFSGNSQDALVVAGNVHRLLPSHDVVGVNYRGYANSEGLPSEKAVLADALVTFDQVKEAFPHKEIVIYGQSLGSSVASYVVAHREAAGAMLITPFDSMAALGQAKYPWLPVHLLVKHSFKSIDFIKKVTEPVSILIAEQDIVVPKAHSDRLMKALVVEPLTVTVPGGHSDVFLQEGFKGYLESSIRHFTEKRVE